MKCEHCSVKLQKSMFLEIQLWKRIKSLYKARICYDVSFCVLDTFERDVMDVFLKKGFLSSSSIR